jgi:hypothetical protein
MRLEGGRERLSAQQYLQQAEQLLHLLGIGATAFQVFFLSIDAVFIPRLLFYCITSMTQGASYLLGVVVQI